MIKSVPESSCLHPRYKKIIDPYTREQKVISYPCGHCWNCIHSFRESWRIRIYETMVWSACSPQCGFIYDTLTVSNAALPSFSAFDYFTGESVVPESFLHNDKLFNILEHYGNRVPFLDKSAFSRFIRLGRERYNSFYRKEIKAGKRSRCQIRVFAALEYGPKWGRPHVHLAAFGVSLADWVRFWAKPWRRDMGFTKTKFVSMQGSRVATTEHASRISTYISKYLLKGSLDNPLVLSGIVPKPWRVISHGIGEDMLIYDNTRFRWLLDDIAFNMGNRVAHDDYSHDRESQEIREYMDTNYKHLSKEQIDSLKLYVQNGYNFALPRYYRDRLLATHSKGLSGCAIKASLYEDACDDYFEEILQYASDCNFFPKYSREGLRDYLERDLRAYSFVCYRYRSFKRVEGFRKAQWHRLSSINSYNRLFSKKDIGDVGLLL